MYERDRNPLEMNTVRLAVRTSFVNLFVLWDCQSEDHEDDRVRQQDEGMDWHLMLFEWNQSRENCSGRDHRQKFIYQFVFIWICAEIERRDVDSLFGIGEDVIQLLVEFFRLIENFEIRSGYDKRWTIIRNPMKFIQTRRRIHLEKRRTVQIG